LARKKKRKSKVDCPSDFEIKQVSDGCVLINHKMKFQEKSGHTHIYKHDTCEALINMICNHTVPTSPYLRQSARRISRDSKYLLMIEVKICKDGQKLKFVNVNNGC
jgi:hypothetical protein